jgi:hypothetical protein
MARHANSLACSAISLERLSAHTLSMEVVAHLARRLPVKAFSKRYSRPLRAHREAIAVGEPFLHLGLVLSVGVVLAPLLRRLGARQYFAVRRRIGAPRYSA